MLSVNNCMIAGYLTKDPEIQQVVTRDGEEVSKCEFTLALNHYKDDGADFVQVVAWRKIADDLAGYKKKGEPLYVEGPLRYSSWEAHDSKRRSRLVLVARTVQYLPSGRYDATGRRGQVSRAA